jgi:DNA-binding LytR/AlgR family response regulator
MIDKFRRPLPLTRLLVIAGTVTGAVAIYCVGYTWLAGRPETLPQALGWAIANVLPWLLAIEWAKRAPGVAQALGALVVAAAASLLLGYASAASASDVLFELWRRLPSFAAAAAIVALLRSPIGRGRRGAEEIRLLPQQIEWVRAAGNYVELRAGGRTIVQRGSLAAYEHELSPHGFVRIHRSMLVRRDRIARIRREDVVLQDGTHLPVGKRYRTAIAA